MEKKEGRNSAGRQGAESGTERQGAESGAGNRSGRLDVGPRAVSGDHTDQSGHRERQGAESGTGRQGAESGTGNRSGRLDAERRAVSDDRTDQSGHRERQGAESGTERQGAESGTGRQGAAPGQAPPHKRQSIRLPFEKKPSDVASWSYDHRAGIFLTLILYLFFGIVFVGGKIMFNDSSIKGEIFIHSPEEVRVELTPEQQQILARMQAQDYSAMQNVASNENAEQQLDANLKDDRGTEASRIYEDAGKLEEQMRANRELYEAGLRQEQAMAEAARNNRTEGDGQRQDTKTEGKVTVRFSFANPVRTSVELPVPAYRCERDGMVELSVTLDTNGHVTAATVVNATSNADECMRTTAISSAKSSRFNLDTSAPAKHTGTITYTFAAQ